LDKTTKLLLAAIAAGLFVNAGAYVVRPAKQMYSLDPDDTKVSLRHISSKLEEISSKLEEIPWKLEEIPSTLRGLKLACDGSSKLEEISSKLRGLEFACAR
jgi:hypothetical protein